MAILEASISYGVSDIPMPRSRDIAGKSAERERERKRKAERNGSIVFIESEIELNPEDRAIQVNPRRVAKWHENEFSAKVEQNDVRVHGVTRSSYILMSC